MELAALEANYSPICPLFSHFLFSIYNPLLTRPSHVKYYSMHTTPPPLEFLASMIVHFGKNQALKTL